MATLPKKLKLLGGLLTGEKAMTGPFNVTVDVTRRCNLKCPGCLSHSPDLHNPSLKDNAPLDLSVEMFKALCAELKEMNTSNLMLIGEGEPLLHPRVFDLISIGKDSDLSVMLLTNGTLIDEKIIRLLIDSRLDILRVSLWASSEQEYARNYPGTSPGNFKKVVESLKNLACAKKESKTKAPAVVLQQYVSLIA